jgi:uncharacterized repeat protein (TIGR01451 family)
MNTPQNTDGSQKPNSFTIGTETSNIVMLSVVEPKLTVVKKVTPVPSPVPGGVQYEIDIINNSSATAFDITIADPLPSCVFYSVGTLTLNGSQIPGNPSSMTIPLLHPGQSATITFMAIEHCDCSQTNTVKVRWSTEPGPRGTANATPGPTCAPTGERCYVATATASVCAHICGTKFADLNGNGVQDAGEPPVAGWPINATGFGGAAGSTTTDSTGHYCLDVPVGTNNTTSYNVCEGSFPGWTATTANCKSVTVNMNTTTTIDFGNQPACAAKLCGKKMTTTGQPVGGWNITATPPSGPVVTATTAADGSYCMMLFGPNSYTITEETKTGWLQTGPVPPAYSVKVTCSKGIGVISGVNPNQADFTNRNVCANVHCPLQSHCDVGANGAPTCVSDIITH